ncbi:hypothetical protein R3P38DRAFT_2781476 [Favolaschia claudopus]|uniref:Uncharacterized protein n=1 Tax=Favolaschia claudopus TaxID=2862362 RepID=A0AAW0B430_9AGAR
MPPARMSTTRRVVPSRRTGGKVGNCDVDNMIFEARLERSHATSLPAWGQSFCIDHHFRAGRVSISTGCNRRLQEASLNLVSIQTPEYERIPENDVSRDPCSEVELFMISDDSYLKRHKRYEKLEKGERLRQREKLQHLYYKLNERIKQLRSMDISEFEGAPASMFPSTPSGVHDAAKIISLGKFSGTSYHSEELLDFLVGALQVPHRLSLPGALEAFTEHLAGLSLGADSPFSIFANSNSQQAIPSLYHTDSTFWLPSSPPYFALITSTSTRTPTSHRFFYWDPLLLISNGRLRLEVGLGAGHSQPSEPPPEKLLSVTNSLQILHQNSLDQRLMIGVMESQHPDWKEELGKFVENEAELMQSCRSTFTGALSIKHS